MYYKVKNITFRGDGFHIKQADSNVSPTTYYNVTVPFDVNNEEEYKKNVTDLCKQIMDGNYHMMKGMLSIIYAKADGGKTDYSLIDLETRIHNFANSVTQRDTAETVCKIKGVGNKISEIIADDFLIPLIKNGSFNRHQLMADLKEYNDFELPKQIDKTLEELKVKNDWYFTSCGKLKIFEGYDVADSQLDNCTYIFREEDYDRQNIGTLHNKDKAIAVPSNPKTFSYLYNATDYWLIASEKGFSPAPDISQYKEMKDLYIQIKDFASEKGYTDIVDKCDEVVDKLNTLIPKDQLHETDKDKYEEPDIER